MIELKDSLVKETEDSQERGKLQSEQLNEVLSAQRASHEAALISAKERNQSQVSELQAQLEEARRETQVFRGYLSASKQEQFLKQEQILSLEAKTQEEQRSKDALLSRGKWGVENE